MIQIINLIIIMENIKSDIQINYFYLIVLICLGIIFNLNMIELHPPVIAIKCFKHPIVRLIILSIAIWLVQINNPCGIIGLIVFVCLYQAMNQLEIDQEKRIIENFEIIDDDFLDFDDPELLESQEPMAFQSVEYNSI